MEKLFPKKNKILFSPEGVGQTEERGQEYSEAKREKLTSTAKQKTYSSTEKDNKTSTSDTSDGVQNCMCSSTGASNKFK